MGLPMMPRPMKPIFMRDPLDVLFGKARPSRHAAQRWSGSRPAEAGFGIGRRPVFAADPAAEAELVDLLEDEGPVDLAGAGLVAARVVGDLHVGDQRQVLLDRLTMSPSVIWQ